jgi:hypothetical protein
MSLLSKLTLGAVAVLGVYALKPRRTSLTAKAGSVSSPRAAHEPGARATTRKRSAKRAENGAGSPKSERPTERPNGRTVTPKARTRNQPGRQTKAKRAP